MNLTTTSPHFAYPARPAPVVYGGGVLAGIISAVIIAVALSRAGSPLVLLAYLGTVPLFMAGFGAGIGAAFIAVIVSAAGLFAIAPVSFGIFYLTSDAIPAAGLILLAMSFRTSADGKAEWCSEGKVLTALVSYPCLIFLGIYAATMGHDGGLLAMTNNVFAGLTDQVTHVLAANGEKVTSETTLMVQNYMAVFARITPALLIFAWLFSTLIAMVLAQSVLQNKNWNLRPIFTLMHLRAPTWVVFAAAFAGLVAVFAPAPYDYVGLNLALAMGVPFFFVGLAVVHAWAARTRMPVLALIVFYVLISVIVYLVLLVAMVGVVDQWVDFRKRFADRDLTK